MTYTQEWTEENRLKRVTGNGQDAQYFYDGDGNRVKKVQNGVTMIYIGALYEKNLSTGVETSYYFAGAQRIAMRQGSTLYYFVTDTCTARNRLRCSAGVIWAAPASPSTRAATRSAR